MYSRNKGVQATKSMAFRLTLSYAVTFSVFLVIALAILYYGVGTVLDDRIDADLIDDISEFRLLYEEGGLQGINQEIDKEILAGESESSFIRLLDENGRVIHSTDLETWAGLRLESGALGMIEADDAAPILVDIEPADREFSARFIVGNIAPGLFIHLGESLEEQQEILQLMLQVYVAVLLLGIPIASLVCWLIARNSVIDIKAVTRAAKNIEQGQLLQKVEVRSRGDEVEQLSRIFNAMSERINTLIIEMREMTDNIAHDLRSPITRIRAISEARLSGEHSQDAYQSAIADTVEECDRLIQLINTTLDVAEVETGIGREDNVYLDISQLTEDACELFEPVADEKGIELQLNLIPHCPFYGNVQNLQRMLANLLDNALKYTPCGGRVDVLLDNLNDRVNIAIADTGIGVPAEDQSKIFDRFYRCDQSRSQEGCGLGLSFARAVARAHGGDITLDSALGRSVVFKISFPASAV